MHQLYPLKFKTIFKDKIWGGDKIKTVLGKDFSPLPNCGETWELSGVEGNISQIKNGSLSGKELNWILEEYGEKLVGEKIYEKFGTQFPLLVKFIDANEDLSIQVHPDDKFAKSRHNSFGKTEMWYVIQRDEGAQLISGFQNDTKRDEYLSHLHQSSLINILNQVEVDEGDCFFIPAGRVHSIGKGILLAEIQQTSDVTYRIYDFDRTDNSGKKRELHTEQALDVIDYSGQEEYKVQYTDIKNRPVTLVECPYFTARKLNYDRQYVPDFETLDSFIIYTCLNGNFTVEYDSDFVKAEKGEVLLIPAALNSYNLKTDDGFTALETYIN